MLVNQNRAAQILGVTRQYVYKLSKRKPRPTYFIELKEGLAVDTENTDFKYLQQRVGKRQEKKVDTDSQVEDLINAVDYVIMSEFGEEKALQIKFKIIERLNG